MIQALVHVVLVLASLLTAGGLLLLPHLAAGGLFFGVTVPAGFATGREGRGVAGRFRGTILVQTALALAGLALGAATTRPIVSAAFLSGQALAGTWAWMAARRRALPHATAAQQVRRAALAPAPAASRSLAEVVPFAFLASAALALRARGTQEPLHAFGPLLAGAALCAAFLALRAAVARHGRALPFDARAAAARSLTLAALLWSELLVAAVLSSLALSVVGLPLVAVVGVALTGMVLLLAAVAIAVLRVARSPAGAGGDNTPDAAWRLGGMVYVNRADPALFVPRRMGFGCSLNFGHPGTWWVLALSVGTPLAVALALSASGWR